MFVLPLALSLPSGQRRGSGKYANSSRHRSRSRVRMNRRTRRGRRSTRCQTRVCFHSIHGMPACCITFISRLQIKRRRSKESECQNSLHIYVGHYYCCCMGRLSTQSILATAIKAGASRCDVLDYSRELQFSLLVVFQAVRTRLFSMQIQTNVFFLFENKSTARLLCFLRRVNCRANTCSAPDTSE